MDTTSYEFATRGGVWTISFNRLGDTVAVVVDPSVGELMNITEWSQVGGAIAKVKLILELEEGSKPISGYKTEKVLA